MNTRTIGIVSGLLGFLGVLIGAFGAHALKGTLIELGTQIPWETASRYHLLHSIALFALGAWVNTNTPSSPSPSAPKSFESAPWLRRAAWSWLTGIIIFSGSLYWYALGGPKFTGAIAPIGGTALMLGWLCIILHTVNLTTSSSNAPR